MRIAHTGGGFAGNAMMTDCSGTTRWPVGAQVLNCIAGHIDTAYLYLPLAAGRAGIRVVGDETPVRADHAART